MACIAVYCSRELFPIPVTYVYIIYDSTIDVDVRKCSTGDKCTLILLLMLIVAS